MSLSSKNTLKSLFADPDNQVSMKEYRNSGFMACYPGRVTHLRVSSEHLQLLGTGARADGESEGVVKLVDDQVQVHRLLPVYVRVTNRQLAAVLAEHFHLRL